MEQFIRHSMIIVLVIGVFSTFCWQYLTYKKLIKTGKKTSIKNIKKLPTTDKTRNKILLLKKIGDIGISAYLIWFLTTLIRNFN